MMKNASRMMLAAAAASMAVMPIAAQANTRAGDSGAVYSTSNAQPGLAREANGEKLAAGGSIFLLLGALAAAITGLLIATDVIGGDDDDDQSPGT